MRYGLQLHQLHPNAIFHLSCRVSFAEGYLGLWPTVDLWAKYYGFRAVTLPNPEDDPSKEKDLVQCGAAAIQARRGSKLARVMGLETCKKWQRSFFYVKNRGLTDRIRLPPFAIGTPSRTNWKYSPDAKDAELKAVAK